MFDCYYDKDDVGSWLHQTVTWKPLLSTACEYTGRMLHGHEEGGCGDDLWSMMYDHIDDYLMILLYNAAAMADCYYDEDDDGMCLCAL